MTGILDEMQRVVNDIIGDETQAKTVVHALIKNFGGDRMYIPMNNYEQRNTEIKRLKECGVSTRDLAKRYQLCERTIRTIINT